MRSNGRSKPPLVADRRKKSVRTSKKGAATKRTSKASAQKSATRKHKTLRTSIVALVRWVFRTIFSIFWAFGWRVTAVIALFLATGVTYYASGLPPASTLVDGRTRGSVTFLDRSGDVFAWRGDQFGGMISAASVSPHLRIAVIATEDKRF